MKGLPYPFITGKVLVMSEYYDLIDIHLNDDRQAYVDTDYALAMEEARMLAESEPVGHLDPWEI